MNEEILKAIREFDALPDTAEKAEICRQYMNSEICPLDFFLGAKEYINKLRGK